MNWGYRIILAYLGFVVVLIVLAFKSFNTDVNLVAEDYYQKELAYQQQIDKIINERALETSLSIQLMEDSGHIEIRFPLDFKDIKGQAHLYRPSDASLDRHTELRLDSEHVQLITTDELASGLWKLQLTWTADGVSYYKQQTIYLP